MRICDNVSIEFVFEEEKKSLVFSMQNIDVIDSGSSSSSSGGGGTLTQQDNNE
jgi:hypothetical protein